ncbi:hypothetical protein CHGG_08701 [Chaetomium globosum CBS 148.51]|uniref:Ureidoglycolate hydrolase n=1 Tax=Chaetomium globosum (strain ATCC 6205 / CBS 148.51 / DSM 1962 / NBRC 6347 / NRRL 1970) TaxID=306901 RepID=Q2GTK3_CHAGB|nr:uncharacterized protein CHGG_08701 [Chaetomium globosum CBS 148.51]EAQ84687.1 hypothetical protein CHGG_08701 [Chaetomium globosum CBS 148.51]
MNDLARSTIIEAVPLTPEAFAPFGDVIENPRPDVHPSSADKRPHLPFDAIVANQGSAIKYQHLSRQINLYDQAPSGQPGSAVMNMFVCAARARIPDPPQLPAPAPSPARNPTTAEHQDSPHPQPSTFPITVLERHPYTTQTFIPLAANPTTQYLVIVAPTLPPPLNGPPKKGRGGGDPTRTHQPSALHRLPTPAAGGRPARPAPRPRLCGECRPGGHLRRGDLACAYGCAGREGDGGGLCRGAVCEWGGGGGLSGGGFEGGDVGRAWGGRAGG